MMYKVYKKCLIIRVSERCLGNEQIRNDGGSVTRIRAHHVRCNGGIQSSSYFQSQQRSRAMQFVTKRA